MRGPNDDLKGYLEAVDRLRSVARFFSSNKSYKSSDGVLSQVNSLLAKAISKMENEFQKQITSRRFFQLNFAFNLYLVYDL
jgi:exocyst complex component 7